MNSPDTFGQWMKQRRTELDLTRDELAGRVSCSPVTIKKIETDERRPSKAMSDALARALQIPSAELNQFLAFARGIAPEQLLPTPASLPDVQIPLPPAPLVNRLVESAAICERLRRPDVRLLTLTGPGGVGKTRLAIQTARVLQADFADGVRTIYLGSVLQPELFLVVLAHALGLSAPDEHTARERLALFFQDKQILLVLDNFEQILISAVELAAWLELFPGLKLLVTSRARLRLVAEHEYSVPPMQLPDLQQLPPADELLAGCPAVELFVRRVQAIQPAFQLTQANAQSVAAICVLLDGLPLAIELAAARCKLLAPAALLDQLRRFHPLRLLTGGAQDLPLRQQTLRQTMDWSFSLLGEAEGRLFERLGVFSGGASLEAIQTVWDGSGGLPLLDLLQTLMDHSLIWRANPPDQAARFEMLVTLREYALERLEQSGELADCHHRHAAYFDEFTDRKFDELRGFRQVQAARSLATEQPNLRLALEWCCSTPADLETGMRLASHLWEFWMMHADNEEGRNWMERLLAQPGAADILLWRAHLLNGLGELTQMQIPQARRWFDESLALFRELGDRYGQAWVLCHLGQIAILGREYDLARARLKESLDLFQQLGADWNIAWIYYDLAEIANDLKQFPAAESHLQRSLEFFERLGDRRAMAVCNGEYGAIARRRMDFPSAIRSYTEALRLVRIVGDPFFIASFSFYLADVYLRLGDLAEATPRLLQRLWTARQYGNSPGVAFCLIDLARVAVAHQSAGQAAAMLGAASTLLEHAEEFYQNYAREYLYPLSEQEVRLQLSDQDFDQAWENGRKSLDGVLKFLAGWQENGAVSLHPRDFPMPPAFVP